MEAPSPADTDRLVDAKVPLVDVSAGGERELTPATLDAIVASLGFGRFQLVVVTLLSVQSAVAAVETALVGYLTPCACAAWGLGYGARTTLNAAVFVGQIAGAVTLAPAADVVGRFPVVLASQLLLTLFGGLSAAVASFDQLVACRFAVGFAEGCSLVPLAQLAEFVPPASRGAVLNCTNLACARASSRARSLSASRALGVALSLSASRALVVVDDD